MRLTPLSNNKEGQLLCNSPIAATAWKLDARIRVSGGRQGAEGLGLWLTKEPITGGTVFGGPSAFQGVLLALDSFDNDGGRDPPHVGLFLNDGSQAFNPEEDGASLLRAGCQFNFRNQRTPIDLAAVYRDGRLQVLLRGKPTGPYSVCIDEQVKIPAGYHLAFSAATGVQSDKHDVIAAHFYNLAPGQEDKAVLERLHASHASQPEPADDAGAPSHSHTSQDAAAGSAGKKKPVLEVVDDSDAPAHRHTSDSPLDPYFKKDGHGDVHPEGADPIASKHVGQHISEEDMVFFKWRKRFEKVRARFREVADHDDHDHELEIPDSLKDEPMMDAFSNPQDISSLYEVLAEEIWNMKTMTRDSMTLIAALDEQIRHGAQHSDDQHKVFADGFERLLREVATRHTVEDALKEQLLRFEYQKNDLAALSSDFASNMKVLRTEFDSVSHTVRSKVGAQQEIMSAQLKDMAAQFKALQDDLRATITQQIRTSLGSSGTPPPSLTYAGERPSSSDSGYSVAFYAFIAFQLVFLVLFYYIRVKTAQPRKQGLFH